MIMTYGYITLFASAFPFGSACTVLFLYIEIRSDIFKLERLTKRPHVAKTHTIGTWFFALSVITYGSIFTNMMLCCFASDQIDSLIPWMSQYRDFSKPAILMVVLIEHFMMILVLIFKFLYDREPKWL